MSCAREVTSLDALSTRIINAAMWPPNLAELRSMIKIAAPWLQQANLLS